MFEQEIESYLKDKSINKLDLKAIIFDMDGVLYDSMWQHEKAWVEAFKEVDLDFPPELAYLNEGRTGYGTIDVAFRTFKGREATPEEIEHIYSLKSRIMSRLPKVEPMKGMVDLLQRVKDKGFQIWVVTGSSQQKLVDNLISDFPGLISRECMVTGRDVIEGKPHPEPYLKALHKANLEYNQAVVIENAPLGIESSHKAGIFTLAINTGILEKEILGRSGADIVLSSAEALQKHWDDFLNAIDNIKK